MNDPFHVTNLMHCSNKNSDGGSGSEGKSPCESKSCYKREITNQNMRRDFSPELKDEVGDIRTTCCSRHRSTWDNKRKQTKVWRQTTVVLVVGSSKVLQISLATTGLAATPLDIYVTVNGSQRSGEIVKQRIIATHCKHVNYSFRYLIKAPCFSVRSIRSFVDDAKHKHFDNVRSCFLWRHAWTTHHLLLLADADAV